MRQKSISATWLRHLQSRAARQGQAYTAPRRKSRSNQIPQIHIKASGWGPGDRVHIECECPAWIGVTAVFGLVLSAFLFVGGRPGGDTGADSQSLMAISTSDKVHPWSAPGDAKSEESQRTAKAAAPTVRLVHASGNGTSLFSGAPTALITAPLSTQATVSMRERVLESLADDAAHADKQHFGTAPRPANDRDLTGSGFTVTNDPQALDLAGRALEDSTQTMSLPPISNGPRRPGAEAAGFSLAGTHSTAADLPARAGQLDNAR